MGIFVKITKYKEESNTHFYELYSLDGNKIVLYMKIDPKSKRPPKPQMPMF